MGYAEYAEGMEAYRKAWAAYATQRYEEAAGWARRSVAADPENPHSHALLGNLAYLKHDLADAKTQWQKALSLNPQLGLIREQIQQVQIELDLEGKLRPANLGPLTIRIPSGLSPEQTQAILQLLSEALDALEKNFQYRIDRPLTVLIYPAGAFYETTQLPTEVLGLFDGKVRLPDRRTSAGDLAPVLRHEVTHAVVYDLSHGLAPRWLQEGLAQECEGKELQQGRPPPLRDLLGIPNSAGEPVWMSVAVFYPASHSLVRYLLETWGWDRMRAFLKGLGEGRPVEDALASVYGWDLVTLERKWNS